MTRYSHRERLMMIFAGERPDRHAVSFWRHFFHAEHHAQGLTDAMLHFQKKYDWDFMKINPRADYHVEDWGLRQKWSHDEFKKHTKENFPVTTVDDWEKIERLSAMSPVLSEHLSAVSMIKKKSLPELPILMTVFTPLAIAGRMVEDNKILADHLTTHPEKVESALQAITETFCDFVSELRNAGADGIFFATTQWASSDLISWEDYERFGVPYDLKVIEATGNDAINLFHVCSSNNFLKELTAYDYHCQMYNWESDDPTNLPLDSGCDLLTDKAVVGGVDRDGWLLKATPKEIGWQIDRLKDMTLPGQVIIGPGCSIAPEVPHENLQAIRDKL